MAVTNDCGVVGPVLYSGEPLQIIPSADPEKRRCQRIRDGAIFAILPDGTPTYNSPSTDGAYERCTVQGDTLVYAYYDDPNSHTPPVALPHVHVVAWKGNLPRLS